MAENIDELISDEQLTETLCELVDTPSPTGDEALIASKIVTRLHTYGIDAHVQNLSESQANAIGKLTGSGDASLLLYAPVDTVTSNNEAEDVPWVGPKLRDDMRAKSYIKDDHIFGLGAHNPKGHAACILESARILASLDPPLPANLHFGFGAGGMPTHSRDGHAPGTGHGRGCVEMLAKLPKIDAAIIAKSGTSVTWEEVGFIWLEVTVAGKHNYVGARHLMPYDNAIANAAKLILKLEPWFEEYADRHASDFCKPQGTVAQIASGWKRMPAFTPECAKFLVDLRFGPNQVAAEVEEEFRKALQRFSADLNIQSKCECVQVIDASRTSPDHPIIQSTISVWERIHGRPHEAFTVMSGATDANMLRGGGIPTARIGLAKARLPNIDFALGMNCVALSELRQLTKFLVLSAFKFLGDARYG